MRIFMNVKFLNALMLSVICFNASLISSTPPSIPRDIPEEAQRVLDVMHRSADDILAQYSEHDLSGVVLNQKFWVAECLNLAKNRLRELNNLHNGERSAEKRNQFNALKDATRQLISRWESFRITMNPWDWNVWEEAKPEFEWYLSINWD